SRPNLSLGCPTEVVYGEPTALGAVASDAEGEPLRFVWKLNGIADEDQTMAAASLVLHDGDLVSVTAIDASGTASVERSVRCRGADRPTVTVTCPTDLVFGEPA